MENTDQILENIRNSVLITIFSHFFAMLSLKVLEPRSSTALLAVWCNKNSYEEFSKEDNIYVVK